MTSNKAPVTPEKLIELALIEFKEMTMPKMYSDVKKVVFMKSFKSLDASQRAQLSQKAAGVVYKRYSENDRFDASLYLFTHAVASERDWESARVFLDALAMSSTDADFFKELALGLMDLVDTELSSASTKLPLAQTALVLLTELGLIIANHEGQASLDPRGSERVVEYITSSLLARSNVNKSAMRIALVHYLSRCGMSTATQQLNRVMGRFGQSLLEDLLTAILTDKKRENAAFHFLLEHLNLFFTASPSMAEMTHSVLRHQMLKFPDEFPSFMAAYSEYVEREESKLRSVTKHLALLVRSAIDVAQRPLADALTKILLKHLEVFKNTPQNMMQKEIEVIQSILEIENVAKAVRPIFDDLNKALLHLDRTTRTNDNVVELFKVRAHKDSKVRVARLGEELSPLESMLQLAS